MNVVITGISGFVGSYLAKHLIEEGSNVYGLVIRKADEGPKKNHEPRDVSEAFYCLMHYISN